MPISNIGQLDPFVSVIIGDRELGSYEIREGTSPNNVVELSVTKLIPDDLREDKSSSRESEGSLTIYNSATTAKLTLNYANTPDLIDYIIGQVRANQMFPPCRLQYGYVNGPKSPVIHMTITSIKPTDLFSNLEIEMIPGDEVDPYKYTKFTQGFIDHYNQRNKSPEDGGTNGYYRLSELVTDIANYQGWIIGNIVETIPQDGSTWITKEPIKILDLSMNPIDAINDLLGRYPNETAQGEVAFVLTFKYTQRGGEVYFVPSSYLKNAYEPTKLKSYDFYINALPYGQVIDFSPKFENMNFDFCLKTSEVQSLGMISKDTNEIVDVLVNWKSGLDNNNSLFKYDDVNTVLMQSAAAPIPNTVLSNIPNYMSSLIRSNINDYVYPIQMKVTAAMTVVGDPELNVLDFINVIPLYPQSSYNTPPKVHPSGGTYKITKITDVINTVFTSELELTNIDETYDIGELTVEKNKEIKKVY